MMSGDSLPDRADVTDPLGPGLIRNATRQRTILAAGFALLLIALLRTAWLCDDSYISFRTADNILNGYGPVWNVNERVQAFTHPLWLAVCTVAFAVTGNVYYTAIGLGLVVTLASVALLTARLASTPWNLVVCFAALLSSKAFIDYSTSGLENPLTHLLLLIFVWEWWRQPETTTRLKRLSWLGAACMLNRIDLGLIVAPALAYAGWRLGVRRALTPLIVGFLPFIAWELFATFYYGTPFPNTAYAKLSPAIPIDVRLARGVDYLSRTLLGDPATLPAIALSAVAVSQARQRTDWPLLAGVGLYLCYVVTVGGDFMMGRFLTAPFIVAVGLLARAAWARSPKAGAAAAAAVLVLGLVAPWEPALLSGIGYSYANNWIHGRATRQPADDGRYVFLNKITDERRLNYEFAGLLKVLSSGEPDHVWRTEGLELRASGKQVVVRGFIGLIGYYAGPQVHIVDFHGLSDALLARLPGGTSSSIMGHLPRPIPEGYVETIASGTNHLANANLAAYYDSLHLIIAGPLWSGERLGTLLRFLSGCDDHYLRSYLEQSPIPLQ